MKRYNLEQMANGAQESGHIAPFADRAVKL